VKRQLSLWLALCVTFIFGTFNGLATTTNSGSFTDPASVIKGSWSLAPNAVYPLHTATCPNSSNSCGMFNQALTSSYSYLNDSSAPRGTYWGWHNYSSGIVKSYLDGLVIGNCSSCSGQHFTFTLTNNATFQKDPTFTAPTPTEPYTAPTSDAGYFLSASNQPSDTTTSVKIDFGTNYVKHLDFEWGSVDTWNQISFHTKGNSTITFYGSDLCSTYYSHATGCFNFSDPKNTGPTPIPPRC